MNRRSQRTRAALKSAFIELVLSRGYEPIAVTDIIRRAKVGRSTFYLHYTGKEALLTEGLDYPCRGLAACAAREPEPGQQVALLEHFRAQRRLNRVFFEPPIRTLWARVLARAIGRQLARPRGAGGAPGGAPSRLLCLAIAEMQIALITHWLDSPVPAKAEIIAALLFTYTQALVQSERTRALQRR
ncbi:MAG: TetR family transcriptional regulator [Gammaproteobacteria bacterium]|nr:TetR family transcriptional regulator [Gammaproteobacteria bacterium]